MSAKVKHSVPLNYLSEQRPGPSSGRQRVLLVKQDPLQSGRTDIRTVPYISLQMQRGNRWQSGSHVALRLGKLLDRLRVPDRVVVVDDESSPQILRFRLPDHRGDPSLYVRPHNSSLGTLPSISIRIFRHVVQHVQQSIKGTANLLQRLLTEQ